MKLKYGFELITKKNKQEVIYTLDSNIYKTNDTLKIDKKELEFVQKFYIGYKQNDTYILERNTGKTHFYNNVIVLKVYENEDGTIIDYEVVHSKLYAIVIIVYLLLFFTVPMLIIGQLPQTYFLGTQISVPATLCVIILVLFFVTFFCTAKPLENEININKEKFKELFGDLEFYKDKFYNKVYNKHIKA